MADFFTEDIVAKILIAVITFALTLLGRSLYGRRGLFAYTVGHSRVGVSTVDDIFGIVEVLWNKQKVDNLFASVIHLQNESFKDYENVVVSVFTGGTNILTEKTSIVGTTHILEYTDEYARQILVPSGKQATAEQRDLYLRRRDFLIPTMNRGQAIQFNFLTATGVDKEPSLWLDIYHKGVKLKFRTAPMQQFLGVPQPTAAIVGMFFCVVLPLPLIVTFIDIGLVAVALSFILGLTVLVPGALLIKLWRWGKDVVSG